jgi:hypothetical protein
VAAQTERAVQHLIEVAANAGAPDPGTFRSQIQGLADHSGFPEQFPVGRRATLPQDRLEPRQHSKAEGTVGSNVLMARERPRKITQIAPTSRYSSRMAEPVTASQLSFAQSWRKRPHQLVEQGKPVRVL